MRTMNDIAEEYRAEGIGIKRCVLLGDEDLAKHMVKNVFDAKELFDALRLVARLEVLRLDDKLKRFCCEKGEALRLSGTCCPDCAAISDGYAAAMTPNASFSREPERSGGESAGSDSYGGTDD